MRKMNETKPKTKQKRQTQFTMRADRETLEHYRQLAKKAGKQTLANLVRELLAAFERNPEILNYPIIQQTLAPPDPAEELRKLTQEIKEANKQQQLIEEKKIRLLEEVKRVSIGTAVKGHDITRQDIHAWLEGLDQSGEAIFDE